MAGWGKRRALIASGLLLAVGYVAAAAMADAGQLADTIAMLGLWGCTAVLGLSVTNYLLRFYRWQHYIERLGRSLPVGRHLLVYLSGFAFTVSPAKAGEAVRSLYLRDHGVAYSASIAALFVERLLDLFAIIALASIIVIDRTAYRPLLIGTSAILAAILVCVSYRGMPQWVDRVSAAMPRRIARLLSALAGLLRSSRTLLHPRPLLFGLSIGLVAWAAEGFGFYLICQGLQIPGGIATFIGIYAVAVLGGSAAFFLPAGIGGMEIVMSTLLVQQGAPLRTAIVATLLCRLATLWFAVILGVGAAGAVEVSERQSRARVAP
ncbi:MAG TPA: lysylphosphatidylglycerol synthase transmembrane domain-containing protein [Steroidobacteraceae bacterium]|nr:lysylphosphatidylglycerol synthase transmembrane domain-containing protein [Steroidobacteraceae bacterium]